MAMGSTSSFPLIKDLPDVLDSTGWTWRPFEANTAPVGEFWVGVDRDGNKWLTKLRGAFRGYREIVFGRLAQAMGWSCQSSVFLRLSGEPTRLLGARGNLHAAHWFMPEHRGEVCSNNCAVEGLLDREIRTVDDLKGIGVAHLLDWPRADIAACLFGANEPSGRLITTAHELVIIDSELMFSSGPAELSGTGWWNEPDGRPSLSGRALAIEICQQVAALTDVELVRALVLPRNVLVKQHRTIAQHVQDSRAFALRYLARTGRP